MCGSDLWVGLHRAKAVTRALSALCWKIRAEIFGRFGKWFAIAFTCAMALGVVACSESAPVLPAQFSPNAMANTVQPQDFEQVAHQLWRRQLSTVMPPGPLRLLETVNLGHAGKPRVYVVTGTDGDFYIVVQLLAETIFKDILGTLVRVMRVDDTGTILWQNLGVQTYLQGSVDRTDAPLTVTALSGGGIELFYEHFGKFQVSARGAIAAPAILPHPTNYYAVESFVTAAATRWVVAEIRHPDHSAVLLYNEHGELIREISAKEVNPCVAFKLYKLPSGRVCDFWPLRPRLFATDGDAVGIGPDFQAGGATPLVVFDGAGQQIWRSNGEVTALQTGADQTLWTVECDSGESSCQWLRHRQRDGTLIAQMRLSVRPGGTSGPAPRLWVLNSTSCMLAAVYKDELKDAPGTSTYTTAVVDLAAQKITQFDFVDPITVDAAGGILGDGYFNQKDPPCKKNAFWNKDTTCANANNWDPDGGPVAGLSPRGRLLTIGYGFAEKEEIHSILIGRIYGP